MRRSTKMLMARSDSNRDNQSNREYGRMENPGMNYEMRYGGGDRGEYGEMNYPRSEYGSMNSGESRFRDRRGREHYDNGRFAPMRGAMDDREDNYLRGGGYMNYAEMRGEDGRYDTRSHYPFGPVPPVYERGGDMNQIGFSASAGEFRRDYPNTATYPRMNEMQNRGGDMWSGGAHGDDATLTKEMADEWMSSLKNEDGTKGPHWSHDQIKQLIAQRGIKIDPMEFYVIMNALYADYCSVLKKHNVNNMDFYVDMATAWINDKDAKEGKVARYFRHIVK